MGGREGGEERTEEVCVWGGSTIMAHLLQHRLQPRHKGLPGVCVCQCARPHAHACASGYAVSRVLGGSGGEEAAGEKEDK